MDIGKAFVDSWNVYIRNFILVILAFLLVLIITIITLGILSVPVFVGFQMMFVKAKRLETVSINELFAPIKNYFKLIFAVMAMGLIGFLLIVPSLICYYFNWNALTGALLLAAIIINVYLCVSWMFSLLLIQDKGLSIKQAFKISRELVSKNNFLMHFLLILLVAIIGQIGVFLWGIGVLLTTPFGMGAIACAYTEETK